MGLQWMWFTVFVTLVRAAELSDEEYYQMPRLFELDDYEECLASRRGAFCLGTFDLMPYRNSRLLNIIQRFSEDKYHFNHTHIHRGYCLTSRCAHVGGSSLRARFQRCVEEDARRLHGLEANLTSLQYCRTSARPASRPVDSLDLAFAYIVALIFAMNIVGTAYDVFRNADGKPNKYLMTWSLKVNWARLTADYKNGDPRLAALKPVQGMKAITMILIMLAHSVLAYHITYIYNPLFLEKASHFPLSVYFQNGTSIVHTFIMLSSFLFAYNLLLHAGDHHKTLSLRMLPTCLMHRISRILPVYMFVLGVTTTWWSLWADGPLWAPLVGGECARCRDKWWAQLLFVNNLVRPDVKCLIHTWFLAVDMQLYIVSAILTLSLGRDPRRGMRVLAGIFTVSVLGNFLAAYLFDLRPMVTLMFPEYMRTQFEGMSSFKWLYQAPWDSLPAALIGIFAAFLHYHLQKKGYKPKDSQVFRVVYRMSVPAMFLWVFLGCYMKGATNPLAVSLYAATDRVAFIALTATAMIGFFNQVDSVWWRFLSWRGWEVLGRMSLPVYLLHWLYALTTLAARSHLSPASVHEIGGHFLWTVSVTYWTALPLHLFVELPLQKFLQSVLS